MTKVKMIIEDCSYTDWLIDIQFYSDTHCELDWQLYVYSNRKYNTFYYSDYPEYELTKDNNHKFIRTFFHNYIQFNNSIQQYLK